MRGKRIGDIMLANGYRVYNLYKPAKRLSQDFKRTKRACLDQSYECPSPVDEQQLKDLHITISDPEL